jgi:hypothetical protein
MPALVATVSVNPTVVSPNQQATVQLSLYNASSSAATVTGIFPSVGSTTAPINMGSPPMIPGFPVTVPANGGVLNMSWGMVPFAPQSGAFQAVQGVSAPPLNPATPQSENYAIGAVVQTSDNVFSTAATQTVQVVYTPNNLPTQPLTAQLRFDSSFNSCLESIL